MIIYIVPGSDCKTKFMAKKSVQLATARASGDQAWVTQPAYDKLVRDISAERSKIRNSSDILYKQYQMYGCMTTMKRTLMAATFGHFETTFMRYGKGLNGIIGITLKPNILIQP